MRFVLVGLLALLSPTIASAQTSSPRGSGSSTSKIELKPAPEKSMIRPGEPLKLKVELWNLGPDDVIVAQHLGSKFGNSELRLFLERGSIREEGTGLFADGIPKPDPDFEKIFVTNWLTLDRGHFYGTYVYMDPIEYPHLRKPGQYEIRAEYYSRGISSTPGWNSGYLKQQDVENLPLLALKGTTSSNTVSAKKSIQN